MVGILVYAVHANFIDLVYGRNYFIFDAKSLMMGHSFVK